MSLIDVLASKTRINIIKELSHEPKYVTELAETIGMNGKSAVHHLETLEDEGIVETYRKGNRKYYRLEKKIEFYVSPPPEREFILQSTVDT
jgi:predicted transcriptional regulator